MVNEVLKFGFEGFQSLFDIGDRWASVIEQK